MTNGFQTRVRRPHSRPRCGVSVPLHGVGSWKHGLTQAEIILPKYQDELYADVIFPRYEPWIKFLVVGFKGRTGRTCVGYASSINSSGAALEQNEMPTPTMREVVLAGLLEGRALDVLVALAPMSIPTFQDVDWIATPANITKAPINSAALRPSRSDTKGENGSPYVRTFSFERRIQARRELTARLPRECAHWMTPSILPCGWPK
jgi:hypothetical protein